MQICLIRYTKVLLFFLTCLGPKIGRQFHPLSKYMWNMFYIYIVHLRFHIPVNNITDMSKRCLWMFCLSLRMFCLSLRIPVLFLSFQLCGRGSRQLLLWAGSSSPCAQLEKSSRPLAMTSSHAAGRVKIVAFCQMFIKFTIVFDTIGDAGQVSDWRLLQPCCGLGQTMYGTSSGARKSLLMKMVIYHPTIRISSLFMRYCFLTNEHFLN